MKIIQNCANFLLLTIGVVTSVNVLATDYYWETSHPPGDTQWTEGTAITGSDTLSINNSLNTTQDISNDGIVNLYSNMTLNNDLTGTGPSSNFYINNGATLQTVGNISISSGINNLAGGRLSIPSSSSINFDNNVNLFNKGVIDLFGTADGNIINFQDAIINFSTDAVVASIGSYGSMILTTDFTLGDFVIYGNLLMAASLDGGSFAGGCSLFNYGQITVSGKRSITNGTLTSFVGLKFSITNAITYDSLSVDGDITLNNSIINVTSSFSAPGANLHWDILSSGTGFITSGNTVINIPASTAFEQWSSEIVSNTILRIFYINNATPLVPLPGVDTEIANVLAAMQSNVTNSGQAELLAAVNSVTTQDLYNYLLNNLQPDTNNSSSSTTLAMQNIGFNKIESRVAGTSRNISGNHKAKRNSRTNRSKENKSKNKSGFASGDLTPNTAMWMAGFGSLSKQHAKGDNQGYRAKILGGMLGIDSRTKNDDVYGIAFGVSNANVYGLENTTFTTRILGYNLMLYGANNFKNNFFAEWIVSGVINKNHGVRVFGVNGIDLSTDSSYRGALGGARVNVGKMFKLNNTLNLSQVNTVQYVLVHQSDYDESGSVAALHVATKENQSILTLGTGLRLGIFNNDSWLTGNRELRAMVTYDVISPNQATTANFVVGSDSFLMNSSAVRLALKLGADYGVMISRKLSLQFSYDYEMRAGYYDNFGEVKLRYLF